MRQRTGSEKGRRLLLAAGTGTFTGRTPLTGVPAEIAEIVAIFSELHYERQLADTSLNPTVEQLRTLLREFKSRSQPDDLAVVYYTSHGEVDPEEQNRFYVLTQDSGTSLSDSAFAAEDMARALVSQSKTSQLILILDVCYAGAGAMDFLTIAGRFAQAALGFAPELFILAASRAEQEASQGALSAALESAFLNKFGQVDGATIEYLSPDNLMQEINDYLDQHYPSQVAYMWSATVVGTCRLFRNPHYLPGVPAGSSLELQHSLAAQEETETPRTAAEVSAWYFTGRQQALDELSQWLEHDESDGMVRVITGSPGCGKSALLANVALQVLNGAANGWHDKQLAEGGVDGKPVRGLVSGSIFAHGKLLDGFTADMAGSLGVKADSAADLVKALEVSAGKYVVTVDGLDEAEQTSEIISKLLIPLAQARNVFLIVATRPDSVGGDKRVVAFGEAALEIDLDDVRYIGTHDVSNYVERRLLAADEPARRTPYRGSPGVAHEVARVIARRADGNFLVATTVVQALLASDRAVDVRRDGWIQEIPDGLDTAFSLFLAAVEAHPRFGVSAQVVRSVLLALAFAEGEGLPWVNIWPTIASALSSTAITDADIAAVQKCAAAFIVEGSEHKGSVYRIFHQSLAEQLRRGAGTESINQKEVLLSLLERVPRISSSDKRDWRRAHRYIILHLSSHALKAECLDWMLGREDDYLSFADPQRMLLSLSRSKESLAEKIHPVYAIAFDRIRLQAPSGRRSYLEMVAQQQRSAALASALGGGALPVSWHIPWAQWAPVSGHRSIQLGETVYAIALAEIEGRTVLVSGGTGKAVRLWDLASGEQMGENLRGNRYTIRAVGLTWLNDEPLIVAGGDDQAIRTWGLDGREHAALAGHSSGVTSLALSQNSSLLVSGSRDGRMMTWDLALSSRTGKPMIGKDKGVKAVAVAEFKGGPVAIAGTANGAINVWDTHAHKPIAIPRIVHEAPVCALAHVVLAGGPSVVVGYENGFIRTWSLTDGTLTGQPIVAHRGAVRALAVGWPENPTVIVSGGDDGDVKIWDLLTGQLREILRGHNGPVSSIVLGQLDSRPIIVSGSEDATVRVWEVPSSMERESSRPESALSSLAVSGYRGAFIAATGGHGRAVEAWDLSTGALFGRFGAPASIPEVVVAVRTDSTGSPVWAAGVGNTLQLWQELPRNRQRDNTHHHPRTVTAVALWLPDRAHSMVATAIDDGTLRLLSVSSQDLLCGPFRSVQRSLVRSLAFANFRETPLLISGDDEGLIQAWNVSNGEEVFKLALHRDAIRCVHVSEHRDSLSLVSCGEDKLTVLWDASGPRFSIAQTIEHEDIVTSASLLHMLDSRFLVSGCIDGSVRLHDEAGEMILSIDAGAEVVGVAVADNGGLAVATKRGLMRIETRDCLVESLGRRGANSRSH